MASTSSSTPPTIQEEGSTSINLAAKSIEGESFFAPKVTRAIAEEALRNCPPGAYLIRPSSQPNCVAISHRKAVGVGHALIARTAQGKFVLEKTDVYYDSVWDVIQSLPLLYDFRVPLSSAYRDAAGERRREQRRRQRQSAQVIQTTRNENSIIQLLQIDSLFDQLSDEEAKLADNLIAQIQRQLKA